MEKQILVTLYHGILFSNRKKKETMKIWNNMDKSQSITLGKRSQPQNSTWQKFSQKKAPKPEKLENIFFMCWKRIIAKPKNSMSKENILKKERPDMIVNFMCQLEWPHLTKYFYECLW